MIAQLPPLVMCRVSFLLRRLSERLRGRVVQFVQEQEMPSLRLKDSKIVSMKHLLDSPAVYLPDMKAYMVAWPSHDKWASPLSF